MNKCDVCKSYIYTQHSVCPLCGKSAGVSVQSETSYPQYAVDASKSKMIAEKILLFIVIASSAISVFINIFLLSKTSALWSVIVSASLVSLWLIIRSLFKKRINAGGKILYCYGIISIYITVIDIFSGFKKWSTTYVIPFLTIAVALTFTILIIMNKSGLKNYLGVLIVIFFVSLLQLIIFLVSLSFQAWTSLVAVFYSFLTIIGFLIFSKKSFKIEIKKRFHF